jgi:hypothetical protein
MSFHPYLTTIKNNTGKGPEDFRRLADQKGFSRQGLLTPDVKAAEVLAWLKEEFALGHGHAMAIYALLKGIKEEKY